MPGPCSAWASADDVDRLCPDAESLDAAMLGEMLSIASGVLYELTARKYAGVCTDTVRPCSRYRWYEPPTSWTWREAWGVCSCSRGGSVCGCTRLAEISLGAYPLRDIEAVRIDGSLLDESAYLIRDRRWLVRSDGNGWPCCQDLTADPLTDDNTFEVTYTWGRAVPGAGILACVAFAAEMTKACSGQSCKLPERVQTITREGVGFALLDPQDFLEKGRTGIYAVDVFITAENPHGHRRPAAVFSPDIPSPVTRMDRRPGS